MDIIFVCLTRERADYRKRQLTTAGLDMGRVRFVTVRGLGFAEGMQGVVFIEAGAFALAQRLGLDDELMVWAADCMCGSAG